MKRILFVDDEAMVLDGLRRLMRRYRKQWAAHFVESGADAIALAQQAPFDAIVSDMRMPGMDGGELLTIFREDSPQTLRFILSGNAEVEAVMRTIPVAHQFLAKPCAPDALFNHLERAFDSQMRLCHDETAQFVGDLAQLETLPSVYVALTNALADPKVGMSEVAAIIEGDLSMSAKVLQIVNSAFFGLPQTVATVDRAAHFLGLDTIQALTLAFGVFAAPTDAGPEIERFIGGLQRKSLNVARLASQIIDDSSAAGMAFTAGVLHDVGWLVLASARPGTALEIVEAAKVQERPLHHVEDEYLDINHTQIGGYLLDIWGLPYPIIEAATSHHAPTGFANDAFGVVGAVHAADALVEARMANRPDDAFMDLDYLEAAGVSDRIPEWTEHADALFQENENERSNP